MEEMAESKYGKYFRSEPRVEALAYHPLGNVSGVTFPDEVFIDGRIIEGCPVLVDIGWRWEIPKPDPVEFTHTHDFDEVLCFIGSDHKNPRDLGAEIEFFMGGETHLFDKTTVIFIPKGVPHCPFTHKRVDRPFLLVVFASSQKYPTAEEDLKKQPEKYGVR
jgi:hypothetical protein